MGMASNNIKMFITYYCHRITIKSYFQHDIYFKTSNNADSQENRNNYKEITAHEKQIPGYKVYKLKQEKCKQIIYEGTDMNCVGALQ